MFRLAILVLIVVSTASAGAQSPPSAPVVPLALRDRLQQVVVESRAAIDVVDMKKVSVEAASSGRVEAAAERARQSHHLISTAAEFARQNPSSMSAQLILLLQLDGYQAQVDSVSVNLESAIARASAADAAHLGIWADRVGASLDVMFKVRMELETVVSAMVADAEKRLRACEK